MRPIVVQIYGRMSVAFQIGKLARSDKRAMNILMASIMVIWPIEFVLFQIGFLKVHLK